ncbi:MAG: hypothetical protein AAF533_29240 [Acidobacteriota bacterium]
MSRTPRHRFALLVLLVPSLLLLLACDSTNPVLSDPCLASSPQWHGETWEEALENARYDAMDCMGPRTVVIGECAEGLRFAYSTGGWGSFTRSYYDAVTSEFVASTWSDGYLFPDPEDDCMDDEYWPMRIECETVSSEVLCP